MDQTHFNRVSQFVSYHCDLFWLRKRRNNGPWRKSRTSIRFKCKFYLQSLQGVGFEQAKAERSSAYNIVQMTQSNKREENALVTGFAVCDKVVNTESIVKMERANLTMSTAFW